MGMYEKVLNFLGFETEFIDDQDYSGQNGKMEISFLHPKSFDDVTQITDTLNSGNCAIVNLAQLSRDDAKRITDFAYGSVYAVQGNVNKLSEGLFLFSPRRVKVNLQNRKSEKTQKKSPSVARIRPLEKSA